MIAKIAISPLRFASPRQWVINLIELISNPDGIEHRGIKRDRYRTLGVLMLEKKGIVYLASKQHVVDAETIDERSDLIMLLSLKW